jgi:hypothetical protein
MRNRLRYALVGAALVTTLACGAVAAAPAGPRIQTMEYVGGGIAIDEQKSTVIRAGENVGAVVFRGGPERFVSIEIEDTHGLPVTGIVIQPGDDAGTHICGATEKPLKVRPYEKVTVFLMNGVCGDGGSVATAGTVTATFSRT